MSAAKPSRSQEGRQPSSGTYVAVRPPHHEATTPIPRLTYDSMSDEPSTDVSDIADDLARLSMPTGVPTLRGAIEWNELAAPEAWLVSVVRSGFTMKAIVEMSPFSEGDTLTLLSRLVDKRIITIV